MGEYGLALDEIAYVYLNNDKPMPADQFRTFEKLAIMMELEKDAEYDGVARQVQALRFALPSILPDLSPPRRSR